MAAMDLAKCLQEVLVCSLCIEYFISSVIINCGHNFCRICLLRYSDDVHVSFSCPECHGTCQLKVLEITQSLGRLVVLLKQLGPHLLWGSAEEEEQCERHQKSLKLFCPEDKTAICISCYYSKEHGECSVSPIEEAAKDYRESCLFRRGSSSFCIQFLWTEIVLAAEKKNSAMVKIQSLEKTQWRICEEHLFQQSCILPGLITELEEKCQRGSTELI
ncbi:E3 ubiquitin-protein ligase TRIM52-like [Tachyglossus aculeatus]|uniref:E3 ubiquitin-protein ligase TRIM52-like n=1 Tax=Tachyglossus aculeatus TaxID=9261 RepID=UPI0018F27C83|nr:E3 ubiquitin-protein ligase TRIM52-like [Tachyglossus aculeatus]